MTDEQSKQPSRPLEFELEPLPDVVVDPNVGYQPGYYPGITQRGDNGLPVPDQEGYHCPYCDYDLRRLTGRICPECGGHFTIAEARRAGLGVPVEHQQDNRVITGLRLRTWGSAVLIVASLFAPAIANWKTPTWNDVGFQVVVSVPFAFVCMLFWHSSAWATRDGVLICAALYAIVSFILQLP